MEERTRFIEAACVPCCVSSVRAAALGQHGRADREAGGEDLVQLSREEEERKERAGQRKRHGACQRDDHPAGYSASANGMAAFSRVRSAKHGHAELF